MPAVAERVEIRPQEGPQEAFLSSPADIAVYGGMAGGGKTYALLLEALRNVDVKGYYGVIFRRESTQVRAEGGLWDDSTELYPAVGGVPKESSTEWHFPAGSSIRFTHLEHEKNRLSWQGAQIAFIGFDEICHFTKKQFWYMLSRARTTCGVRPYVRCTCNPDPDSFVAELVSWWIDEKSGLPIPERSGVLRYFIRVNGKLEWGDTVAELCGRFPGTSPMVDVKSFTFIASSIHDNKILMEKNPEYLGYLRALPMVDRERLLGGNWKIRATAGNVYRPREWMKIVEHAPKENMRVLRYWDRAGTDKVAGNDPAWTAGCKLSMDQNGIMYVENMARFRGDALKVEQGITNCAAFDGVGTEIFLEQDPGSAGKMEVGYLIRKLMGYTVVAIKAVSNKIVRAKPASAQMEAGNIKLVCNGNGDAKWAKEFIEELEAFPDGKYKDQADAFAGAVAMMVQRSGSGPRIRSL